LERSERLNGGKSEIRLSKGKPIPKGYESRLFPITSASRQIASARVSASTSVLVLGPLSNRAKNFAGRVLVSPTCTGHLYIAFNRDRTLFAASSSVE